MKFAPLEHRVKGYREPWITHEAIEAIKDKDRLLRKATISKTIGDWEEAKRVRNKVGKVLRTLRADFLKQQQEASRADPKKILKNYFGNNPQYKAG